MSTTTPPQVWLFAIDRVRDELGPTGADVLDGVEDVHLLFHLQLLEHVAGDTQQSTATGAVHGHNQ